MTVRIFNGDCRDVLRSLKAESVHMVVTSPPYWGLRDYGIPPSLWDDDPDCEHEWGEQVSVNATNHTNTRNGRDEIQPIEKRVSWLRTEVKQGQFCQKCGAWVGVLGLEPDYRMFVSHMVEVFREVRRVMRADATLWLNLGDSYATGAGKVGERPGGGAQGDAWAGYRGGRNGSEGKHGYADDGAGVGPMTQPNRMPQPGLKAKDLCGIPWRVAFALQEDGWWLRQDIIWKKDNPMPESVTDRCTKAHEYLFLLAKSERYYFDQEAITEPCESGEADLRKMAESLPRIGGKHKDLVDPLSMASSATNIGRKRSVGGRRSGNKARKPASARGVPIDTDGKSAGAVAGSVPWEGFVRNKRSVWTVNTAPFAEAHFATFPPALIEPCILAGCPEGGTVLDPFFGAGTSGLVSDRLRRDCIGIELNPQYVEMAQRRITDETPLFTKAEVA